MSVSIQIPNFNALNVLETTKLITDAVTGSTTLSVQNSQGYALNDFVVVGRPGSDGAEIRSVTANPTLSNQLAVTTTGLKHNQTDSVVKLFGDQIKVYRAPNVDATLPAIDTYTEIATITIAPDDPTTLYTDAGGSNAFWYKYTYANSVTNATTSLSDSIPSRGDRQHYCSISDVRNEAGLMNAPFVTDLIISAKRDAAEAEINGVLSGFYSVPFIDPINPLITDLTARLAAGLLLVKEYEGVKSSMVDQGEKKISGVRDQLKRLQSGDLVLSNDLGVSIANTDAGGFSGWPNSKTNVGRTGDLSNGGDLGPAFTRGMQF
jgi:hypothetical protein